MSVWAIVSGRRVAAAVLLLATVVFATAISEGRGRTSDDNAVLTALAMKIDDAPNPVRAVDGKYHLAYEIAIVNQSGLDVRIDSVQARAEGAAADPALRGSDLEGLLRLNNGDSGRTLGPGNSALLFMDVTYRKRSQVPAKLRHRFRLTQAAAGDPPTTVTFTGVPTTVGQEDAIVVEPPLRGDDWVVGNGCCNPINAHRGATLSINGTRHVPERFAIDFVRLDDQGKLFSGPIDELSSYQFYGDKIYSATAGKVVAVVKHRREQVPGSLPEGQTVRTAGGNYVVVKIDPHHYAFYAHMQTRSARVDVGDQVQPGKVLGLLGNTGNTDAPHLHFHIMDGPSPLQSNGLPFVFDRSRGQGYVTNVPDTANGTPAVVDRSRFTGRYHDLMPLGDQLIAFGSKP